MDWWKDTALLFHCRRRRVGSEVVTSPPDFGRRSAPDPFCGRTRSDLDGMGTARPAPTRILLPFRTRQSYPAPSVILLEWKRSAFCHVRAVALATRPLHPVFGAGGRSRSSPDVPFRVHACPRCPHPTPRGGLGRRPLSTRPLPLSARRTNRPPRSLTASSRCDGPSR